MRVPGLDDHLDNYGHPAPEEERMESLPTSDWTSTDNTGTLNTPNRRTMTETPLYRENWEPSPVETTKQIIALLNASMHWSLGQYLANR